MDAVLLGVLEPDIFIQDVGNGAACAAMQAERAAAIHIFVPRAVHGADVPVGNIPYIVRQFVAQFKGIAALAVPGDAVLEEDVFHRGAECPLAGLDAEGVVVAVGEATRHLDVPAAQHVEGVVLRTLVTDGRHDLVIVGVEVPALGKEAGPVVLVDAEQVFERKVVATIRKDRPGV